MTAEVTDALRKEFQFYLDNQDEIVEKYDGKVVAIKGSKILGAYNSAGEALNQTRKTHKLGSFLIQKVSDGNKDYTRTIRSRERLQSSSPDTSMMPEAIGDDLASLLNDLWESSDEAREEGYPIPSETALNNAERLLKGLYITSPRHFEVYPTPDGEIAIDAPGGYNRSVLLLCDSRGGALCLVNINGNHRRARYSSSEKLPDGFIREALADLEAETGQSE